MTPYDQQNIGDILAGKGTWFTANLIRLISVSDSENRTKLHKIYPEEVEAVNLYQHGTPENYTDQKWHETSCFPINHPYLKKTDNENNK